MNRRLVAFGVWAAWIFGSSCTVITTPQLLGTVHRAVPKLGSPVQLESFWDRYWWIFVKGYHVLEYMVLFLLGAAAFAGLRTKPGRLAGYCLLFAASDEFHQHFVRFRGGRWTDVLIDAGGVLLGALLFVLSRRRRASRALPAMELATER